jgi:hypothetical protein
LPSKLSGAPGLIHGEYNTLPIQEECRVLLPVVTTGVGRETDGEGGVAMLVACSVLIMLISFSLVNHMVFASTCFYVLELFDVHFNRVYNILQLEEGGQGVVVLLTSWSDAASEGWFSVASYNYPVPSRRVFYYKSSPESLGKQISLNV